MRIKMEEQVFFHGIDLNYLLKQYPILYPDRNLSTKRQEQLNDRNHLIQKFGFEPIHLLESSDQYSMIRCLKECIQFGELVFAFKRLHSPIWQISLHEIAVPVLDVRNCHFIFFQKKELKKEIVKRFPDKPLFFYKF
ncbi:hypothetical protein [Ammoniphilus resinae]|uniref:Uncharacterized protein n=1 Tax=Ammoniphilus resinae TaxID=861532 RepID=A0ABS4GJG1_9BACL|nr:hypothetical protein [Ammoniphilus resinae]MBP1930364.1 hypothetical protein [Ammoniphilus resinae]